MLERERERKQKAIKSVSIIDVITVASVEFLKKAVKEMLQQKSTFVHFRGQLSVFVVKSLRFTEQDVTN